jgi:hypothetical protein
MNQPTLKLLYIDLRCSRSTDAIFFEMEDVGINPEQELVWAKQNA